MVDNWTYMKNVLNDILAGGRTEKRSWILSHMPRGMKHTTFDCYLNYLHKAGHLMKPRRGWYRLADGQIPTDLSISDVKSQAYGVVDFDGARRVIDFDDVDRIRNRIVGEQRASDPLGQRETYIGIVPNEERPGGFSYSDRSDEVEEDVEEALNSPTYEEILEANNILPDWRVG